MGFHKRYINDAQVASIYQKYGTPGVVDWFTKGADAIITSGKLASDVRNLMNILPYEPRPDFIKSYFIISQIIHKS